MKGQGAPSKKMGCRLEHRDSNREGLKEAERVTKVGGKIVSVDNYGNDEFCSFSPREIASNVQNWVERGFTYEIINTEFIFDSVDEAKRLLTFYFGENGERVTKRQVEYKVVAYTKIKA